MKTILGVTKHVEQVEKHFQVLFALRKPLLIEEIEGLGVFTTSEKSIFTENSN